jgi:hypothetical protein
VSASPLPKLTAKSGQGDHSLGLAFCALCHSLDYGLKLGTASTDVNRHDGCGQIQGPVSLITKQYLFIGKRGINRITVIRHHLGAIGKKSAEARPGKHIVDPVAYVFLLNFGRKHRVFTPLQSYLSTLYHIVQNNQYNYGTFFKKIVPLSSKIIFSDSRCFFARDMIY